MKRLFRIALAIVFVVGFTSLTLGMGNAGKEHGGKELAAKEHGGKEHGGEQLAKEHGGKEQGSKEHGGKEQGSKEHGGKEHGGTKVRAPSKDDIRNTMKNYVFDSSKKTGAFEVLDVDTGNTRRLELIRVHERVGKTGEYFYSCADFKDLDSGELLDLDLDVEDKNGNLSVVDVRIHKISGIPRYTYDDNDNRIPLMETKSHLGKKAGKAEKEHGGKEHGGKEHGSKEHGGKEHGGN